MKHGVALSPDSALARQNQPYIHAGETPALPARFPYQRSVVPPRRATARQPPGVYTGAYNAHMMLLGGDRSRSLHFAGRRAELAALHGRLEYVVREQDPEDGLVLIDGIQGIGKTGLLREFARQAVSADRGRGETEIVHLPLVAEELGARPGDLASTMLNGIPPAVPKDIQGAKREVTRAFAWVKRTVKRGPGFELRAQADLPLNQLLRDSKALGWWDGKALLLTIDEVQNIDGNGRSNLATLHEGKHGCPILVVCAGLQHSRRILQDPLRTKDNRPSPTISRFSTFTLDMLSRDESIEAVRQSVLKAGNRSMPVDLAERIADASSGFPQHLHGYVQGSVSALGTWGTLETNEARQWVLAQGEKRGACTTKGAWRPFRRMKALRSAKSRRSPASAAGASVGATRPRRRPPPTRTPRAGSC